MSYFSEDEMRGSEGRLGSSNETGIEQFPPLNSAVYGSRDIVRGLSK